ncbi:PIG-L family deacetylase [Ochrobactrum sp. Marseille-Q0166]|nr:PIG-L family deacetylase [Ochrobactrum sp. Marseille-Q0166]
MHISDDIEIGCGGTILHLAAAGISLDVQWCVLSGSAERHLEAEAAAYDFLRRAVRFQVHLAAFEDSYFPAQTRAIKEWLISQRQRRLPDIIFTHRSMDAHQEHRTVNELTWNVFSDQPILEYEIPKWDGDLGQPNTYCSLSSDIIERKIDLLITHFGTQRCKDWFDTETFKGLARLRGMECRASAFYAEAFFVRKIKLFWIIFGKLTFIR